MCIAIASVRSLEIFVFAIEHFWAVSVLKLHYSIVCLHHTLFSPVHSGGCFSEHIFALGILMSNAPKGSDIIETDFMLDRIGMPHDMPKKFHALLRKTLSRERAFVFPPMYLLMHPCIGAFLF